MSGWSRRRNVKSQKPKEPLAPSGRRAYAGPMKAVTVREAQSRLRELIAEACQGELIVLTDGEKQVALEPHVPLELERDTPELESELLKAIDGPFAPYSAEEMKAIGKRVLAQKQQS